MNEVNVGFNQASKTFNVSHATLDRALKAFKDGRPVGRCGRPPKLSEELDSKLAQQAALAAAMFKPWKKMEIRQRVCMNICVFVALYNHSDM